MYWLPGLRPAENPSSPQLAARDDSAGLLAKAAQAADRAQATVICHQALRADPGLALWTLIASESKDHTLVASMKSAAAWLAEAGWRDVARWLRGGDRALAAAERFPRSMTMTRALETAEVARRLASGSDDALDEAYWLALLSGAADSLAAEQYSTLSSCARDRIETVRTTTSSSDGTATAVKNAISALAALEPLTEEMRGVVRECTALHGAGAAAGWGDDAALRAELARLATDAAPSVSADLERQKLLALAEFAAGAGHEMNNPLAVIAGRAQLLLRGEADPDRRRELAAIHTQAMRVHDMIADLMLFARPPIPDRERRDIGQLAAALAGEIAAEAAVRNVGISLKLPPEPVHAYVDPRQFGVALRAILDNALFALEAGGGAAIEVASAVRENGEEVVVTVSDTGPGIPADVREHLFDPFYSGRSAGRGLGTGLAKAWRIVEQHGGSIEVENPPLGGAKFVIRLASLEGDRT